MDSRLKRILPRVQKPARYTGGEFNQTVKDLAKVDTRIAFCFPDTYEIGMSNLGMRILYGVWNAMDGVWCERVFAPWGDMEDEMRRAGVPLYALESGDDIGNFDIIAFSLGYEMAFTTVLNMLDLAGLPVRAADRDESMPLVIAGGACCCNAEPIADFVDMCLVGEGEDLCREIVELWREMHREGKTKREYLAKASQIGGVYVPSMYEPEYNADGTVKSVKALGGAPEKVVKRVVTDMDSAYFPEKWIVPSTEIVHDRVVLELFRGCIRGCRFCQAGFIYRPIRARGTDKLINNAISALSGTGYEEITLSSLSTSDYRSLGELCDGLLDYCEPRSISLSLPSLRADNFSVSLMEKVQKVRKSGLTFAPEAGSQRLRDAINKNVREEDVIKSCRVAFEGGWNTIKLYFMLGLPTETDEDIIAIAELTDHIVHAWRESASNKARGLKVTVSTSCFIPKPHTPFQWESQITQEEYKRRVGLLSSRLKARCVTYNWHDAETSFIEAALARGDRRLGRVIETVWKNGGKLDSWSDYFSYERWLDAFKECSLDPDFYAVRERAEDEVMPWSVIDVGVRPEYLLSERHAAYRSEITPDCRVKCMACGARRLGAEGKCDE